MLESSHLGGTKRSPKRSQDRKIAIVKFCDRDHIAIFYKKKDRRSPRDREKKIADRDQKIGDRSCLDYCFLGNDLTSKIRLLDLLQCYEVQG